jgi:hypothetical protein
MDTKSQGQTPESVEIAPRAAAPRSAVGESATPHTFRRKIDCEGSPEVEGRRRVMRGAKYPVRDQRTIY